MLDLLGAGSKSLKKANKVLETIPQNHYQALQHILKSSAMVVQQSGPSSPNQSVLESRVKPCGTRSGIRKGVTAPYAYPRS